MDNYLDSMYAYILSLDVMLERQSNCFCSFFLSVPNVNALGQEWTKQG